MSRNRGRVFYNLQPIHRHLEFNSFRVLKIHRHHEFSSFRVPRSQSFTLKDSMWRGILQLLR